MQFDFTVFQNLMGSLRGFFDFCSFEKYEKEKKVFLRHDIDIFVENVDLIARIEEEMGIQSTFCFQPNCEFYNPLSPSVKKRLLNAHSKGHFLCLHVDAQAYGSQLEMENGILRDFEFYSGFFPLSRVISFHKPPSFILEGWSMEGFVNTYEKRFFEDIRYFSDSKRREFLPGLEQSLQEDPKTSIQLVLHPFWWDCIEMDLWEDYQKLMRAKEKHFREQLKKDFEPYRVFFGERF